MRNRDGASHRVERARTVSCALSCAVSCVAAIGATGACPTRGTAQPSAVAQPGAAAAPGITLAAVLDVALVRSPRVLSADQDVEIARGYRLQAGSAFDAQLAVDASTLRDNASQLRDGVPGGLVRVGTGQTGYTVAYQQLLRAGGITIGPEISTVRTGLVGGGVPVGTSTAAFRVTVPLLAGRGAVPARAVERSATSAYRGAHADLEFAVASAADEAARAYWGYAAAQLRLAAYVAAERRALQLVAETRELVKADERPPADTLQLLANAATKAAARIGAEQTLLASREALGLAMGLDADQILTVPPAVTALPVAPSPAALGAAGPLDPGALTRVAYSARADLRAAGARADAAREAVVGARAGQQARLDVSVVAGYAGLAVASGVAGLVSPLHQNVPGMNTQLQISYRRAGSNALARGIAAAADAQYEQAQTVRRDILRRVASGVAVAAAGVDRSGRALTEASHAVTLATRAVANERQKFRLGTATLFDILNAEDALTGAELSEIFERESFADAIISVRSASGTLVRVDANGPHVCDPTDVPDVSPSARPCPTPSATRMP